MKLHVGTSGFSYKEWKGSFYPEKLPANKMLAYYGEHFNAVEVNNTFYRLPKSNMLATWATQVPDDFSFAIKASRHITHIKRLKDTADTLAYLFKAVSVLESKLGLVFFQLPPFLKKDLPRLKSFLNELPKQRKSRVRISKSKLARR